MSYNISEAVRKHQEALDAELTELKANLRKNFVPPHSSYSDKGLKSAKEAMLRRIRAIEAELGYSNQAYNSSEF